MRLVYSLAFYLATPLILLHFAWRARRDRRWLRRWTERFGFAPKGIAQGAILVHAASVGEVNAAEPLIRALLERQGPPVVVTTFTPTGSHRLQDLFGDRVGHAYIPLDLPGACRRLLRRLSPCLLVIMETEIWPNLFHQAARQDTPLLIVNAQISGKSLHGYQRFSGITAPALQSVSLVMAASEEDASRFAACGADPATLRAGGNLKFDVELPASVQERGEILRTTWGNDRKVIVAGSTHVADESVIFEAFTSLLETAPEALLILVPRHPERFEAAAATASERGLAVSRMSQTATPGPECQCYVLDVMGELQAAYGAADVAIIGGSFNEIGGHNPLEAASWGVAMLTGPDMSGQAEAHAKLVAQGAVRQVANAAELAEALREILSDQTLRLAMGTSARAAMAGNRGALEHALSAISELLDGAPRGAHTAD